MGKKISAKSIRKGQKSSQQVRRQGAPLKQARQVQSASELGTIAGKLGATQKAKTHKGRKIIEKRAPKVAENPKRCMFMKGRKSSGTINSLMKDLQLMKGRERVQMLVRHTHDFIAMEDASLVENQSVKYDCSLFAVGSHQKKRPDNLVIGRVFDGHVLDMFELGIEDFRGTEAFPAPKHINCDMKPILIFQGSHFDTSDKHKRVKSLLIDFFHNQQLKEANIMELKRVMVFTCRGEKDPIEFRHLECENITEATVQMKTVPFREVGPSFNMKMRREKIAGTDLFKEACRQPKVLNQDKKREGKNKYTTILGEKKGKIFVQQQDLETIALRKFKGMGKTAALDPKKGPLKKAPKIPEAKLAAEDV